ncbi:hypothetical protein CW304_30890 [Bacillus sp. UFRGS-B20]|nr:hypothetical protein CW304_30890 [Bacillus sp. UFRGS-B20]
MHYNSTVFSGKLHYHHNMFFFRFFHQSSHRCLLSENVHAYRFFPRTFISTAFNSGSYYLWV